MEAINAECLGSITFSSAWEDVDGVFHTDERYAGRVNFWRDLLPEAIYRQCMHADAGDILEMDLKAGQTIPAYREQQVMRLRRGQFRGGHRGSGNPAPPRFGRFYPQGMLTGVANVFPENINPFRCVGVDDDFLVADFNHPLAGQHLKIRSEVHDIREKFEERGGTSVDWMEWLLTGPGIQSRWRGRPTDFFSDRPFERADDAEDGVFYGAPRFVQHIDRAAISVITDLYGRLLKPGATVLDLMSSWVSHLPANLELKRVSGLGMNAEELAANERLSDFVVHDLNRNPVLPYADSAYDAVICTVSVEYLTDPVAVFADVRRVLKPGGLFVLSFSNRWFEPKTVRIWPELHEFERVGLVLEYFHQAGGFAKLHTYSMQGLARPEDDKYYPRMLTADPVFAVWGFKE